MWILRQGDKITDIQHWHFLNKDIYLFLITYMNLWVELDQEPFSFEAQFANLGPIEGIYFCVALGEKKGMLKERNNL